MVLYKQLMLVSSRLETLRSFEFNALSIYHLIIVCTPFPFPIHTFLLSNTPVVAFPFPLTENLIFLLFDTTIRKEPMTSQMDTYKAMVNEEPLAKKLNDINDIPDTLLKHGHFVLECLVEFRTQRDSALGLPIGSGKQPHGQDREQNKEQDVCQLPSWQALDGAYWVFHDAIDLHVERSENICQCAVCHDKDLEYEAPHVGACVCSSCYGRDSNSTTIEYSFGTGYDYDEPSGVPIAKKTRACCSCFDHDCVLKESIVDALMVCRDLIRNEVYL
jgi:hypothetical protein